MNTLPCVVESPTIRIWSLIPMTGLHKMRLITSTEYKNNVNYNEAINSFGDGGEIYHALNMKQSRSLGMALTSCWWYGGPPIRIVRERLQANCIWYENTLKYWYQQYTTVLTDSLILNMCIQNIFDGNWFTRLKSAVFNKSLENVKCHKTTNITVMCVFDEWQKAIICINASRFFCNIYVT